MPIYVALINNSCLTFPETTKYDLNHAINTDQCDTIRKFILLDEYGHGEHGSFYFVVYWLNDGSHVVSDIHHTFHDACHDIHHVFHKTWQYKIYSPVNLTTRGKTWENVRVQNLNNKTVTTRGGKTW